MKVLDSPDVREQRLGHGMAPLPSTPAELGRRIDRELAPWGRVVKEARIKAE